MVADLSSFLSDFVLGFPELNIEWLETWSNAEGKLIIMKLNASLGGLIIFVEDEGMFLDDVLFLHISSSFVDWLESKVNNISLLLFKHFSDLKVVSG